MCVYVIDAKASHFTVQAFAGGLLSILAHNPTVAIRDFAAEFHLNADHFEDGSFHLEARSASLEVLDDLKPKDREEIHRVIQEEVLESSQYPLVRFQSQRMTGDLIAPEWYHVNIQGLLEIHGVAKAHAIDGQVRMLYNGIRIEGETSIVPSQFGLKRPRAVGGLVVAKDELKFVFDLIGHEKHAEGADVPQEAGAHG